MSTSLRVFHLIKSLGRGGAEMLLPETLRHADRERFAYRYAYFLPWKDQMVPELERMGARVDCLEAKGNLAILLAARRVASALREWEADVLHCHLPIAGVVGRIAGRLASVPVVYTEHNLLERYHPMTRRLNLVTWGWQDRVIAVSSDVEGSLRRSVPGRVPVDVVLNGVDVGRFDPDRRDLEDVRADIGIPRGAPIVGTVAVFRTQKQLHLWLRAARRIREAHPAAAFLLVGDGPLREELEREADRLGLDGSVHWTGLREDVRPYLAAMDVYLMSSRFEGLPVALLEAMSMRCAVVSTPVGGIPEVVEDGVNGLLVEDPSDLADAVAGLVSSPGLRDRLAGAARDTVRERFSVQRMAGELESIYLRVVREARNGR